MYLLRSDPVAAILSACSQPAKRRWMVITAVVKFYLESVFNYSVWFFLNHIIMLMKMPVKDCDQKKTCYVSVQSSLVCHSILGGH